MREICPFPASLTSALPNALTDFLLQIALSEFLYGFWEVKNALSYDVSATKSGPERR